ncbi:MAG TPA: HesA/MoeB/ThiF family protein, partial [Flavisolibacter sp.]|nr:HesA/MoeB/ThiF family protein [Flavisolibacter sp.]
MQKQSALYERYGRQVLLKGIGEEGQQKLLQASVLVVGAGGLGCPALQYLAAAGIGKISVVDDDTVTLHNLHRQVLYTTADVGAPKADVAVARLRQMNPDINILAYTSRLTTKNAFDIISQYDFVLDATDNFASRYLINDACVLLNKPLVYGAISQFEGQVAVFNFPAGEQPAANYRDVFPEPPAPGSVLNCAEAGVIGVLPGIIGTVQAAEVIKLITGIGTPLVNQLLTYDVLTHRTYVFNLHARKETRLLPGTAEAFEATDYEWFCGTRSDVEEIESSEFFSLVANRNATAIDVREEGEQPVVFEFAHLKLPLSELKEKSLVIENDTLLLFCQTG